MSNGTDNGAAIAEAQAAPVFVEPIKPQTRKRVQKPRAVKPALTTEPAASVTPTRVFKVIFRDGREVLVHEPKATEFSLYLRAAPAFSKIRDVILASNEAASGVIGLPIPELNEADLYLLNPLLARLSNMPLEEVAALGLFDWMGLFQAMQAFIPKNGPRPTTLKG